MAKKKEDQTLTIEEGMHALEEILEKMEDRDVALDTAFTLYEEGMRILKETNEQIDAVEKKVLALSEDGTLVSFAEDAAE